MASAGSPCPLPAAKTISATSLGQGHWKSDCPESSKLPCGSQGRDFQLLFSDEESDVEYLMDAETSKQITCVQKFLKTDKLRRTKLVHKKEQEVSSKKSLK